MNNEQIIYEIAVGLFGEEQVEQWMEEYGEIPLHTMQGWANRGNYRVKKGEHGIECRLWKKKKRKKVEESEGAETKESQENQENPDNRSFYLCKSYLFRADQVEKGRR